MKTKKWSGSKPTSCNICGASIEDSFIDGRLAEHGSWAIMCELCHKVYGVGLGLGKGQLYRLNKEEWIKVGG